MQKFRRLYALELDRDCMISDRFLNALRIWSWRREPRGGTKQQLTCMFKHLDVNNYSNGEEDSFVILTGQISFQCLR